MCVGVSRSTVKAGKTAVDIFAAKTSCNLIKKAYVVVAMLATSFLRANQYFWVLPPTERVSTSLWDMFSISIHDRTFLLSVVVEWPSVTVWLMSLVRTFPANCDSTCSPSDLSQPRSFPLQNHHVPRGSFHLTLHTYATTSTLLRDKPSHACHRMHGLLFEHGRH
jgi:hypothetical protein